MYKPTNWEERWIERLGEKEKGEPEFVTKRKQEMIRLIEAEGAKRLSMTNGEKCIIEATEGKSIIAYSACLSP